MPDCATVLVKVVKVAIFGVINVINRVRASTTAHNVFCCYAVAQILTPAVNFAFRPKSGFKNKCWALAGFGIQNDANLRLFFMHLISILLCAPKPDWRSALKAPRYCLSRNPRQCMLQVSSSMLQQVETSKYLRALLTSDDMRKEIATSINKANAVLSELIVLWWQNGRFQTP